MYVNYLIFILNVVGKYLTFSNLLIYVMC